MFWTSAKMMIASRAALAPALEDRVPEDRYAELRSELVRRLSRPPYFFVHHDPNLVSDPEETKALLAPLAPEQRLSFTRVQIDQEAAARESKGTRYSRTNQPLAFHTDSAHARRPHSLVAFAMVRPDRNGGGLSSVVCANDVVARLSAATRNALRQRCHDFGRGPMRVLWAQQAAPSIRYYRTQLQECALRKNEGIVKHGPALEELDQVLAELIEQTSFALDAGDILFVNNQKALHARGGFASNSDRLMLRYRLRVREIE